MKTLPEKNQDLLALIHALCARVGFSENNVELIESLDGDLHSNASLSGMTVQLS